jgi:ferredoxin-NADP reductase
MDGTNHKSMLLSHLGFTKKRVAHDVALKGKQQIAEGTMAFIFEKPEDFYFKAGQHVRMTLIDPPETDKEGNRRFLSVASAPSEADLVFAMRMSNSAFKRVLTNMPIRHKVRVEMLVDSPHSSFTLHNDATRSAVFLIGGIGIVPAISIIKDWSAQKLPHKITLFYSSRRPEDAPYLDELNKLAKQNPSLTFVPTMTEPERSARSWEGETGYINKALHQKYLSNLNEPIYYIAGLPEMVDAMRKLLKDVGIKESNIRAEEFSGFKMSLKDDDAYCCAAHPEIIAAKPDTCPKCGKTLVANMKSKSGQGVQQSKTHLFVALILLAVVPFIVIHASAIGSIHSGILSFQNPVSYLLAGVLVLLIVFKIKFLWSLAHRKGKSILELHGLRKDK